MESFEAKRHFDSDFEIFIQFIRSASINSNQRPPRKFQVGPALRDNKVFEKINPDVTY